MDAVETGKGRGCLDPADRDLSDRRWSGAGRSGNYLSFHKLGRHGPQRFAEHPDRVRGAIAMADVSGLVHWTLYRDQHPRERYVIVDVCAGAAEPAPRIDERGTPRNALEPLDRK